VSATATRDPETIIPGVGPCLVSDCQRRVEETLNISVEEDEVIPDLPEPDEFNEVQVENEETGVTVSAGGEGLAESDIGIVDRTPNSNQEYRASPVVRISNRTETNGLKVTIPISDDVNTANTGSSTKETTSPRESKRFDRLGANRTEEGAVLNQSEKAASATTADLGNSNSLSVYAWDPDDPTGWNPIDSEINREAGTATATLDRGAFVSVLDPELRSEWEVATITLEDRHFKDGVVTDGDTKRSFSNLTWETNIEGNANSTVVNNDSLDLRVYKCSLAEATTELGYVDGTLSIPFDYQVRADGWYEYPELTVTVDGEKTYTTREEIDADIATKVSGTTSGSPTAEIPVNGNVTVSFRIKPSQFCNNNDHANTYLNVRNIDVDLKEGGGTIEKSDLKDSNGDGIYDAVAEANPPLPQYLPDTDLFLPKDVRVADKYRINIDPIALDTSGDGILDSETIETSETLYKKNGEWKLNVKVNSAEHHPARVDTNGDGLSDRAQIEGRTIYYTPSSDATRSYIDDVQSGNSQDAEKLLEHFESETATANPFLRFTTRVGDANSLLLGEEKITVEPLTDAENWALGTDPEKKDTNRDNVPDALAVADELNPTLFDATGPKVRFHKIWQNKGGIYVSGEGLLQNPLEDGELQSPIDLSQIEWREGEFETIFRVYDPAGLERAEYQYNDDPRANEPLYGYRSARTGSIVKIGSWETFSGPATSNEVELIVEDSNENVIKREVYSDPGWQEYAQDGFEELTNIPGLGDKIESYSNSKLGQLRGFTAGAEETLRFAYFIGKNPGAVVQLVSQIPKALRNLDEIIKALPASVKRQQRSDNPQLDPDDDNNPTSCADLSGDDEETCKSYSRGWYQGYIGWVVFESVVPFGQITRAGKALERIEDLTPEQIRRYAAAAKSVREQVGAATQATKVRLADTLAKGRAISEAAAQRVLGEARTVGQQLRVSRKLQNTNAGTPLATSAEGQKLLGKILIRTDRPDAGFLASARICNSPCDPPVETLTQIRKNVDGVDTDDVANLAATIERARDRGDIDIDDTEDFLSDLERLSKQDRPIEGLESVIKRASTNSPPPSERFLKSTFKGEVGTVRTAANALDAGKIVTDIDDVIKTPSGKTDIDIRLKDGTAVEVKNYDYAEVPPYAAASEQQKLVDKLRKYAEESDTVVLATRGDPADAEIPGSVKESIESEFPDTTVELKSIDEIKGI
jgi:hypothetical protein